MKKPTNLNRKVLVSAISLAISGGMVGSAYAESPSNEEMWQKIQQQQKMIEQQAEMIREMQSSLGETQQATKKHDQQIEQAARAVKDVERQTAKAEKMDAKRWYSKGESRDKVAVTAGYTYWVPEDNARIYGIECFGDNLNCSSNKFIGNTNFENRKSDFSNMTGAIKWTHEFANDYYGIDDFALGGNFAFFETQQYTLDTSDDAEFQTPYGSIDSSSGGGGGDSRDKAWFISGDIELGKRMDIYGSDVRLFAGLRIEALEWERKAEQDLSSSNNYHGVEKSSFFGAGPRIGATVDTPIGRTRNFSVFAAASGGVMFGEVEREFTLRANTEGRRNYLDHSENEVIPFGEFEAGLGYIVQEDIQIQLGYQGGFKENILFTSTVCTNPDREESKGTGNRSCGDEKSNVWSHGPFLRFNAYF